MSLTLRDSQSLVISLSETKRKMLPQQHKEKTSHRKSSTFGADFRRKFLFSLLFSLIIPAARYVKVSGGLYESSTPDGRNLIDAMAHAMPTFGLLCRRAIRLISSQAVCCCRPLQQPPRQSIALFNRFKWRHRRDGPFHGRRERLERQTIEERVNLLVWVHHAGDGTRAVCNVVQSHC